MEKTYSELIGLPSFKERFEYLKLGGQVGIETFGFNRYLNQALYHSPEWKKIRDEVIMRDEGCDLAVPGREIFGRILVHHINPISEEDVINRNPIIFDLENLIITVHNTHQAIHYGDKSLLFLEPVNRSQGDTKLW